MQQIYKAMQEFLLWKGKEHPTCEQLILQMRCLLAVVHKLKQAGPLMSGILLFVLVHQRCMLCRRTGFVGIYYHGLNGNKLAQFRGCLRNFLR
jgi:hypothetical protein